VGQRGFWDEQNRVAKLQQKKPVLNRLYETIPWEPFRPLLEKGYTQERKSNAGRRMLQYEQIENETEQLRRENARQRALSALIKQHCFPDEFSSS
jgi:hypothetical protein